MNNYGSIMEFTLSVIEGFVGIIAWMVAILYVINNKKKK